MEAPETVPAPDEPESLGEHSNSDPLGDLVSGECSFVLERLVMGDESEETRDHIATCPVCRVLVFGGGPFFQTSLEQDLRCEQFADDMEQEHPKAVPPSAEVLRQELKDSFKELQASLNELRDVAAVKRQEWGAAPLKPAPRSRAPGNAIQKEPIVGANTMVIGSNRAVSLGMTGRRKFLKVGVAGLLAVATAAAFGVQRMFATRPSNSNPTMMAPQDLRSFARFDAMLTQRGPAALQQVLQGADGETTGVIFDWISIRRVSILYPDLVTGLGDTRPLVKISALAILETVPPVDLKPSLPSLNSFHAAEPDARLKAELGKLIARVMKS